jgi:hypothetical protein
MTAPDPQQAASATIPCPLCRAPVRPADERCPECNMTLAGLGGRPAAFTRRSVWLWAGGLLVIYLLALAIVLLAR